MIDAINYILDILIDDDILKRENVISYKKDFDDNDTCKIIIKQSEFFDDGVFGTEKSLPSLPLKVIEGIPVLFGEPIVEYVADKIYIHADLVASSFFFLSRYEETVRKNIRDQFGRFIGKESILYKAGFLDKPVVDRYSALIKHFLGIYKEALYADVCLTHDIDIPYERFNIFTASKRLAYNLLHQRKLTLYPYYNMMQNVERDPLYNIFNYFIEEDKHAGDCKKIYFVKSGGYAAHYDAPVYIYDKAYKKLSKKLIASGAMIGYHSSFEAGGNAALMKEELKKLEDVQEQKITSHRSHFLRSMEPSDMEELIRIGITDDYTMGYADVAGFRLGTARCVRWINPYSKKVTDLVLHPLIAMDNTMISSNYMGLGDDEIVKYVCKLIDASRGGNPSILWHNHIMCCTNGQKVVYGKIIDYISKGTIK